MCIICEKKLRVFNFTKVELRTEILHVYYENAYLALLAVQSLSFTVLTWDFLFLLFLEVGGGRGYFVFFCTV